MCNICSECVASTKQLTQTVKSDGQSCMWFKRGSETIACACVMCEWF